MTINGLDVPAASSFRLIAPEAHDDAEAEEGGGRVEYEPYDTRLAAKVQNLYGVLEAETTAVAKLRREAPRRAAELWWEGVGRGVEGEGDVGGEEEEVEGGDGVGELRTAVLAEGERWEGMRDLYAGACEGLVGLKTGVTETVGRCERAGKVVAEVEGR